MPIYTDDTGRGFLYNKILLLPPEHGLKGPTDDLAARYNRDEALYQPEPFNEHVRRSILPPYLSAARRSFGDMTENAKAFAAKSTTALTPPPTVKSPVDRLGSEIRTMFPTKPGERIAAIQRADAVQLAAILEQDGSLVGLTDQEREMAQDRALRLYHVARTGLDGAHPKRPSIGRVIATGVDADATAAAADAAMADYVTRREGVEADEKIAQGVVRLVASLLDEQPDRALDRILSAA